MATATGEAELCRLELRDNFYVLTLLGNGEHRISPPLVDAILSCFRTLPSFASAMSTALITTSQGKFFSNGVDLAYPASIAIFQELLNAYLNLPMPTIAAVCGHASGGGFIFALAHDHVFMRKHRGYLYMSEIDVQINIPPGPMSILRSKMTPRVFRDVVLCGIKHTAEMASEAGIVDAIHDNAESTIEAASKLAQNLVARKWNPAFYRQMREAMYPEMFAKFSKSSGLFKFSKL